MTTEEIALSEAQIEIMRQLSERNSMLATSSDRAKLSKLGFIEVHRDRVRAGYRRPPWRLTPAGFIALSRALSHPEPMK